MYFIRGYTDQKDHFFRVRLYIDPTRFRLTTVHSSSTFFKSTINIALTKLTRFIIIM